MFQEDIVLELARLERRALQTVAERIAAQQNGELFKQGEDHHAPRHPRHQDAADVSHQ
jgi:hypothetical protein